MTTMTAKLSATLRVAMSTCTGMYRQALNLCPVACTPCNGRLNGRTWPPLNVLPQAVIHSEAFQLAATAANAQDIHNGLTSADLGSRKALYYRVKVENSKWSTTARVKLVADRARPDSLALEANAEGTSTTPKLTDDSLTASVDKYLTRIDLKWAFENDDFDAVPAVVDVDDPENDVAAMSASPRPTGFLIDYFIEDPDAATANIFWQPLQTTPATPAGRTTTSAT